MDHLFIVRVRGQKPIGLSLFDFEASTRPTQKQSFSSKEVVPTLSYEPNSALKSAFKVTFSWTVELAQKKPLTIYGIGDDVRGDCEAADHIQRRPHERRYR